jgi:UDP-N-acetylmuramate dehydrogenase
VTSLYQACSLDKRPGTWLNSEVSQDTVKMLKKELSTHLGRDRVRENEPMSKHTTFRVGGPADIFLIPKNAADLALAIQCLRTAGMPFFILGKGSNLVVRDGGFRGAMILIGPDMGAVRMHPDDTAVCSGHQGVADAEEDGLSGCGVDADLPSHEIVTADAEGDGLPGSGVYTDLPSHGIVTADADERDFWIVDAGAGASFSAVCRRVAEAGLSGLEAISGIPGSIGGALYMNAGAYGIEIGQWVASADIYDFKRGHFFTVDKKEMMLAYRHSVFQSAPWIILSVRLRLPQGDLRQIQAQMRDFSERRNAKQPLKLPSAGSFFKRPPGQYAGRLIEDAGLKGLRVGDAMVSDQHAGFIVNLGAATAGDVLALMSEVQHRVHVRTGIALEPEPLIVGSDRGGI